MFKWFWTIFSWGAPVICFFLEFLCTVRFISNVFNSKSFILNLSINKDLSTDLLEFKYVKIMYKYNIQEFCLSDTAKFRK